MLSDADLQVCICRAVINWNDWRDCFEHYGAVSQLPVLANQDRFDRFANEYGLRWLGDQSARSSFRKSILRCNHFSRAIGSTSDIALDKAINAVHDVRGRKQRSAISKLAAFAAPRHFVALDKFSLKGVRIILGSNPGSEGYADYRRDVQQVLVGALGKSIARAVSRHRGAPAAVYGEAFLLRVLDCALMTIGGRWWRGEYPPLSRNVCLRRRR